MESINDKLRNTQTQSRNLIRIAHVNAENLVIRSHRDEFCEMFKGDVVDIIAVSETFMKPQITSEAIGISNYKLIRNDSTIGCEKKEVELQFFYESI